MNRIAALAFLVLLAACGSDTAPTDRFSGTWAGDVIPNATDTVHFVLVATQTGSTITGTGTASDTTSTPLTFTGTSTPPSLALVVSLEGNTFNYAGTFVSSDSISGAISDGTVSAGLSLKKQ
jgi:lysozyme family protein